MPTNTKMNKQMQDRKDNRKIAVLSIVATVLLILIIALGSMTLPLMFAGPGATPGPTPTVAPPDVAQSPTPETQPPTGEMARVESIGLPSELYDPQTMGSLEITYSVSANTRAEVAIVDITSNVIRTVWPAAPVEKGEHVLTWDGTAEDGNLIAPGEYLVRVQALDDTGRALDTMTHKIIVTLGATPTPEPSAAPTQEPTQTPEPTPTPTPEPTKTPEATPSPTPEPTQEPTPTPEPTPEPLPTVPPEEIPTPPPSQETGNPMEEEPVG